MTRIPRLSWGGHFCPDYPVTIHVGIHLPWMTSPLSHMKHLRITALVTAISSVAVMTQTPTRSVELEERVARLEDWQATAETRLASLEAPPKKTLGIGEGRAERLLAVTIKNKRFDRDGSEDERPGRRTPTIWWDAVYEPYELKSDTRSVQGILQFCDLFGDPQFECRVTINEPIRVSSKYEAPTGGIEFDSDVAAHQWLLSTKLKDMTFRFRVTRVLYMDGKREVFER